MTFYHSWKTKRAEYWSSFPSNDSTRGVKLQMWQKIPVLL